MSELLPHESDTPAPRDMNWGLERRLQFIDFRLRWERRINRNDLIEYFGISTPQASHDIARYTELAPENLAYDRSSKTYIVTGNFRPFFPRSSAYRYLAELFATKQGLMEPSSSFIGSSPELVWAPTPSRVINEYTVEKLVRAIQEKLAIHIRYQSMTSLEESERLLSPHAFGYDGFRWHVRAFCHKKQRFSDFVLARILSTDGFEPSEIDPQQDLHWQNILDLILVPNPNLSPAQKRVVELDYGMENGTAKLQCRQAFLGYTLKRLGLMINETSNPVIQHIALQNRDAIQPYLSELNLQI